MVKDNIKVLENMHFSLKLELRVKKSLFGDSAPYFWLAVQIMVISWNDVMTVFCSIFFKSE